MAAYLVMRREDGKVCQDADGVNFYIVWSDVDAADALNQVPTLVAASGVSTAPWADAITNVASGILLMKGTVINPEGIQFD